MNSVLKITLLQGGYFVIISIFFLGFDVSLGKSLLLYGAYAVLVMHSLFLRKKLGWYLAFISFIIISGFSALFGLMGLTYLSDSSVQQNAFLMLIGACFCLAPAVWGIILCLKKEVQAEFNIQR